LQGYRKTLRRKNLSNPFRLTQDVADIFRRVFADSVVKNENFGGNDRLSLFLDSASIRRSAFEPTTLILEGQGKISISGTVYPITGRCVFLRTKNRPFSLAKRGGSVTNINCV
jgi:hypothetical protein